MQVLQAIIGVMLIINFWTYLDKSADERNWVRFFVALIYCLFGLIAFYYAFK